MPHLIPSHAHTTPGNFAKAQFLHTSTAAKHLSALNAFNAVGRREPAATRTNFQWRRQKTMREPCPPLSTLARCEKKSVSALSTEDRCSAHLRARTQGCLRGQRSRLTRVGVGSSGAEGGRDFGSIVSCHLYVPLNAFQLEFNGSACCLPRSERGTHSRFGKPAQCALVSSEPMNVSAQKEHAK